ncbi:MAG: InlB B-repeat-containing protein, partial [Bacteroidaceae bacterium]|nr:InlB B-repeat-containing protein [Bacteroidaceae bacterium]
LSTYPHAIKVYQLVEEGGTSLTESDLTLTNAPVALNFDLYNNAEPQTISFTTSSTGAVTVSESEYVTTSVNGSTITVTPIKVTPSAQTITVSQAADDTYKAGSATFTVSVANNTPQYNVTYKANGGTGSDVVETYYQGYNVPVAANTFTRFGYIFSKWNTSADGTGTDYLPEATITNISANIDLYAQWEESSEIIYDFTKIDGFSGWNTAYQKHVVNYDDATVTFISADRQPNSAISDQPVTKGGDVSLVLTDGSTINSATFVCTQWGDKTQTITMWYSTDGGKTYTSTGVTSTNFTITASNLPEGTNAVKITFSSTSNQVGITYASIVKNVDNREEAEIAFSVETLTFTEGNEYTAPTFSNPNNVEVTFATTNESVASWNNGLVLGGETGTATITATFEGNNDYKPATATLVVTVEKDFGFVDVVIGSGVYQKITSLSDLEAGKRYLVVYEYEENGSFMGQVMNGVDNANMYAHIKTTGISDNKIDNTALAATPIVLQDAGEGSWFLVENDKCLYVNADGNYLQSTDNPSASGTKWTISYVEGVLKINNNYLPNRYIMYNKQAPRFACYTNTQQNVTLYKELPNVVLEYESVSVSDLKYSTYASDNALDFTGSSIKAFYPTVDGSTLIFHEIMKVPAGTGVLLYSANGAVTEDILVCTGETDVVENNVFVRGTGASVSYNETTQDYIYVLSKPQGDNLGFYKANNNKVAANRAYIQVPAELSGAKSFTINLEDDPTGIVDLNANLNLNEGIYNLSGQRLSKMQKGINIVNGKKIMVK